MKKLFAIPTANGKLTEHFGHCEQFAIVETEDGEITGEKLVDPPVHSPGAYPKYLSDMGVAVIIAGGLGGKAQDLFKQNGIEMRLGVREESPSALVSEYLKDELIHGESSCNHGADDHDCNH